MRVIKTRGPGPRRAVPTGQGSQAPAGGERGARGLREAVDLAVPGRPQRILRIRAGDLYEDL